MAAHLKEHLEDLITSLDKAVADASSDVCRAHEAVERALLRRDEASAKRAECVEALAKLYPPAEPRKWDSLTAIPMNYVVEDGYGRTWKANRNNLWTRYDKFGDPIVTKPMFSKEYDHFGPFTEVTDGRK
ncbi:Uncharacterised protein [Mycobacteroides abscessus subsp. abscessus]|nr:Uncharacterised protein [Mycobacteroides abscessus subsp. abscessus]